MKNVLKIFLLFVLSKAFSQELRAVKPSKSISKDSIYTIENKLMAYPGGISGFRQKFYITFDRDKVNGKGIIKSEALFLVTAEGKVTDIKATGTNDQMNKEVERTIREMSEIKWIPWKVDGKPVDLLYKFTAVMAFEE